MGCAVTEKDALEQEDIEEYAYVENLTVQTSYICDPWIFQQWHLT